MIVFGPPQATHSSNKVSVGILVALALGAGLLCWMDVTEKGSEWQGDLAVHGLFLVLFAGLAIWQFFKKVVIYQEGITSSTLMGEKQMAWNEVEKFYYGATKRSVNFIPIGTYYSFKLVDASGNKIRCGSGILNPEALGREIITMTQPVLLKKAAHLFDSGVDVDFGAIRINRQAGISIKGSFGRWKQMPWNEVHSYAIDGGHFRVWRTGQKYTVGPAISDVPNAFVLHALLDVIFKPAVQGAVASS